MPATQRLPLWPHFFYQPLRAATLTTFFVCVIALSLPFCNLLVLLECLVYPDQIFISFVFLSHVASLSTLEVCFFAKSLERSNHHLQKSEAFSLLALTNLEGFGLGEGEGDEKTRLFGQFLRLFWASFPNERTNEKSVAFNLPCIRSNSQPFEIFGRAEAERYCTWQNVLKQTQTFLAVARLNRLS